MNIREFRRILQQFEREARRGDVLDEQVERNRLADMARDLNARLALNERTIKSSTDTISSAPGGGACPCCGRV